ncbi:hypothetical protein QBC32DRAFT_353541 [Pseudoneurospora amorphoporcata]|uniref:Uncharacterized protein n=1 Tax=Pseudoneurospora amorphoporcata TaxID=241081 RepID=A0AAN6NLD0_9PEZI|nr:hypothetical protein QBC32DRAFT_353541 [Pseudoneurospora amorphoporcata]
MKTTFFLVLTTLASGILASPAGVSENPGSFPKLVERKACYHSSDCSWFYAAKCEQYCRQWGQNVGVDRMEKCNLLNQKRCCCTA